MPSKLQRAVEFFISASYEEASYVLSRATDIMAERSITERPGKPKVTRKRRAQAEGATVKHLKRGVKALRSRNITDAVTAFESAEQSSAVAAGKV